MKEITTFVNARDNKVCLVFTVNGQKFRIATPLSSTKKFSGTEVPSSVVGYKSKSATMRQWYADCSEFIRLNKDKPLETIKQGLKAIITGKPATDATLSSRLRSFAETKKARNTQLAYQCTANSVERFDPSVTLSRVTPDWLLRYQHHEEDRGRKVNGIGIDLRNIRAVLNQALADGEISTYPFRRFRIKREETRKRNLSLTDLRTIVSHGGRYTDTFFLMFCLLGININDLFYLPKDCIRDGRLEYRRNKTGRLFSIKVEPEAQAIIDKYAGKEHLLCFAETCKDYKVFLHHMNKALGEVVQGCTSYWSRHTWASIAVTAGVPIDVVSAALGHSTGMAVTNIYVAYDRSLVDDANRKVLDLVAKNNG